MIKRLGQTVKNIFESSRKQIDFKNISYLPRWAILCFDISILFIALFITKIIVSRIQHAPYFSVIPTGHEFVIIVINSIFFILFRTYAGLIRHSTLTDAIKFILASGFTAITSFLFFYLYHNITGEALFNLPKLIVYTVVSFSGLFVFRIIVKKVFETYLHYEDEKNQINILVLGTGENAIAIASALKSETPARFKVLGFIDREGKNRSKQILGLPIIHLQRRVPTILRVQKAQALILADDSLPKEEGLKIIDDCLKYRFKVYRAPLISDIENTSNLSNQIQKIQIEDILERDPIKLDNKLVAKEIFGKCVLVTGGAGSIGSEIVRQVANYKPSKLLILDQSESPLYQIQLEIKNNFPELDYEAVIADVRQTNVLEAIFATYAPKIVYHAAAYKHVPLMEQHPSEAIFANVLGSKNVADLSYKYKAEKFVMVSTDKAVNPSNVMGASKRLAEMYVQALQTEVNKDMKSVTNFITTRFGNVLGSNGSVVPLFKRQIEEGGPLTITHPDIIRYFMTIPEACQLVIEAGAMGNGGEVFIFDMGEAVKIYDLAKKIIRLAGFVPNKDIEIKVIGLRPGEKLYEELLSEKSKTLPTYHDKIMIAKVETSKFDVISKNINELIQIAHTKENTDIVKKMKAIVPEFLSMNSDYEKLDKLKA